MCTVRATSSSITAAFTASRASRPTVNGPWPAMSTARERLAAQRLDDAAADRVVADQRERADRDLAAELVGDHRQHARDRLAPGRPRGRVRGVVHTHSTYATAWAARGEPIPCVLTMIADEFGGEIPVGPFALIGDDSIGRGIVETLRAAAPARC